MNNINKSKMLIRQRGISLVEIMVALVISIFLLGGVVQVYIGNKSSYRFSDATSRVQENARFAIDSIVSDIRMAGYWGCAQYDPDNTNHLLNSLNTASGNYDANLHDFINNAPISITVNDGLNNSDGLTIRGTEGNQEIVRAPFMGSNTDSITVNSDTEIEANDLVIISDCYGADIFEVTSVTASVDGSVLNHVTGSSSADTPGNMNDADCTAAGTVHCLSKLYDSTASVSIVQNIDYTIAAGASGEPALWRSENGVNEELIEGIEQMQILFGIDTDDDGIANQYLSDANAIAADQLQISSIRVFLVVRSDEDNILDTAQIYNLNGASITAADNRLRQVFSATVALRNRLR